MTSFQLGRALALAVPTALMAGALGSQYLGGLYPCEMCQWQRWPHYTAIGLAALAFIVPGAAQRALVLLAALAIAVSGGIGAFHAGVEYGWWEGITQCATTAVSTGGDFMKDIMKAPLVRCDVAPWTLFGISLAGYNAIISLIASIAIFRLAQKKI